MGTPYQEYHKWELHIKIPGITNGNSISKFQVSQMGTPYQNSKYHKCQEYLIIPSSPLGTPLGAGHAQDPLEETFIRWRPASQWVGEVSTAYPFFFNFFQKFTSALWSEIDAHWSELLRFVGDVKIHQKTPNKKNREMSLGLWAIWAYSGWCET